VNERVIYERRQVGWAMIGALLFGVLVRSAAAARSRRKKRAARIAAVVNAASGLLMAFCTLTVRVTDRSVAWWFTLPALGRRVALEDIESVSAVRTSFLEGWGIHLTWHGWVWNVSGFNAVQITLRSGTRFAIGTSEPQVLIDAVQRAREG